MERHNEDGRSTKKPYRRRVFTIPGYRDVFLGEIYVFMNVFEAKERARRYLRDISPWLVKWSSDLRDPDYVLKKTGARAFSPEGTQ